MPPGHGGHGYSPQLPNMQAAFFICGAGIAKGRDLGVIDMRQIAPTLATQLGIALGSATGAELNVKAAP